MSVTSNAMAKVSVMYMIVHPIRDRWGGPHAWWWSTVGVFPRLGKGRLCAPIVLHALRREENPQGRGGFLLLCSLGLTQCVPCCMCWTHGLSCWKVLDFS